MDLTSHAFEAAHKAPERIAGQRPRAVKTEHAPQRAILKGASMKS
jgi:hypothetical protein